MPPISLLDAARIRVSIIDALFVPCRPRILIVIDGLTYVPGDGFGLTRFIEALLTGSPKPVITLAHRFVSGIASVTVAGDTFNIKNNFAFDTASPAVTLANYDQIWLFGINAGAFYLSDPEVGVISTFMNGGGGLFATGDHQALGRGLSGELPRVRHMREWSAIPVGLETNASVAIGRIDTVVDPGAGVGNQYEFDDQSDDIPQRIYPNYRVVDTDGGAGTAWSATVHPLLMLPGAVVTRTSGADFTKDIDCLPDHPHESVCRETPAGVLGGNYNINGQNFVEYQPPVSGPLVKAEVVAFGVSGGRAIAAGGGIKPPVTPQMFPIISAYDGRLAQPYSGTARPGRIVCDSTWHHFVNINLDGTGTTRTALGTGSGAAFVPGPQLLKIYEYYRNIMKWLQPANRIWCRWYWDLVAVRYQPSIIEELASADLFTTFASQVALGRTAAQMLATFHGAGALEEAIASLLQSDPSTEALGDLVATNALRAADIDPDELFFGILGGSLVKLAESLPLHDTKAATAFLERGIEKNVATLIAETRRAAATALSMQAKRAERRLTLLKDQRLTRLSK